ncbi:MAG: hypothetical protein AB1Z65_09925 [Candidatus Sulfomarinibacteraceae bacterium]
MSDQPRDERTTWLDDPGNVNKICYALYAICAGFALADFFPYKHHLHFDFEYWPGFYSIYGFVSCVALVLAATQLRKILMRDEDFYDDD